MSLNLIKCESCGIVSTILEVESRRFTGCTNCYWKQIDKSVSWFHFRCNHFEYITKGTKPKHPFDKIISKVKVPEFMEGADLNAIP